MSEINREYIVRLLTDYPSNKRKANQLSYELEMLRPISAEEMLATMSFSRPAGEGHPAGSVSDRTARIALSYQEEAAKANDEARNALLALLLPLLRELDRLEHYVQTLEKKQLLVITRLYFEPHSQAEVAAELGCALRTVRTLRDKAVSILVEMYQYADSHF